MKGYLHKIHPVLPVQNVSEAIAYYVDNLGFTLSFKDAEIAPSYAGVVRDGIEIHLQWHDAKEWDIRINRPMLRIITQHIEALFKEYEAAQVFHEKTALKNTPWGTREFAFYDLYRNGLTFYQDL